MNSEYNEFFAKVRALGVDVVKPTQPVQKPITNIYDITNIKEVATVICGIVNTAVNKKGIIGYVGVLPDIYPALHNIQLVDEEFFDMTEDELADLKKHIQNKLHFEGDLKKYEPIVEDLTVIVLMLILNTIRMIRLKKDL